MHHPLGATHCVWVPAARLVAQEVECPTSPGLTVKYGLSSAALQLSGPLPHGSDGIFRYLPRPSLSAPFAFSNRQLQLGPAEEVGKEREVETW